MSAGRRDEEEGSGSRRFYKLVGALVVGLAIAAALVPLWMGGGKEKEARVVEIQPDSLREGRPEPQGAGEAPPAEDESAGRTAGNGDEDSGSGEKWWQSRDDEAARDGSGQPASGDGSEPGGREPADETPEESAAAPASPAKEQKEEKPAEERVAKAEGPYWTVMVGSFRNPDNARGLKKRLREQDFAAHVVAKTVKGSQWNRVYAGRMDSRQEAEALLPRLEKLGYQDLLVLKAE